MRLCEVLKQKLLRRFEIVGHRWIVPLRIGTDADVIPNQLLIRHLRKCVENRVEGDSAVSLISLTADCAADMMGRSIARMSGQFGMTDGSVMSPFVNLDTSATCLQ